MFKIQLQNGEFFMNKSGRIQHYKSEDKTKAKIEKLGEIATGAIVVKSKARTTTAKIDKLEEKASETKAPKEKKSDIKTRKTRKHKRQNKKELKAGA